MRNYPPADEQQQRYLNTQYGPWCMTDCPSFSRDYGTTPFCNATMPRTDTSFTGKCVCPARWMCKSRDQLLSTSVQDRIAASGGTYGQ